MSFTLSARTAGSKAVESYVSIFSEVASRCGSQPLKSRSRCFLCNKPIGSCNKHETAKSLLPVDSVNGFGECVLFSSMISMIISIDYVSLNILRKGRTDQ